MAGDDVCAETHEVVDGAAYAVFVARDRGCRDDDGVAGMNLYLTVAAVCHAGEACHRFALASCGEDADAVVSVAVKFFRFNECAFRRFEVAHFTGDAYDIDHGTAEDADFSLECQSGIDCHLDTGYVGCECGKDNAALGVGVGAHERLGDDGFGRGVAGFCALVESAQRASTPLWPSSASLYMSVCSPSTGEWSNLKSPVWTMVPTGVLR